MWTWEHLWEGFAVSAAASGLLACFLLPTPGFDFYEGMTAIIIGPIGVIHYPLEVVLGAASRIALIIAPVLAALAYGVWRRSLVAMIGAGVLWAASGYVIGIMPGL
ncbi:MAG: hypothetical protein AAFR17_18005 [Pseudomonadota bacterium]